MSRWEIRDHERTLLSGFDPTWLPEIAFRYLSLSTAKNSGIRQVFLEAGPWVGTIPLNNGETLYLLPRVGAEAFGRMIWVAEGLGSALQPEFEAFVNLGIEEGQNSWVGLLANSFPAQLRLIEKRSLQPLRVTRKVRSDVVKGQVHAMRTQLSLSRAERKPVHLSFRSKTFNSAEHRILSAAATALLRSGATTDPVHLETLHRWAARFTRDARLQADMIQTVRALQQERYAGPRSYYRMAMAIAHLILRESGVSLSSEVVAETEPVLTNIALLFERYVRTVLQKTLHPRGYVVEKRESGPPFLFSDGTAQLIPDAVVSAAEGIHLLVDTKYKPSGSPDTSDYYQMLTYLESYGVSRKNGLIVMPSRENSVTMGTKMTRDGRSKIFELHLPLGNWKDSESALELAAITALA